MAPTKPGFESDKDAINYIVEIFGRRWAMKILWELRSASLTFRELQAACNNVSPTVLNTRLKELRGAGFVDHICSDGYTLTPHGKELLHSLRPFLFWIQKWRSEGKKTEH